jgi:hypothetical protein
MSGIKLAFWPINLYNILIYDEKRRKIIMEIYVFLVMLANLLLHIAMGRY